ncbi:hypothetical protein K469DRAFT_694740 [Zopfia rhizophila CBS 207.26]|uniref:Uncharacterized protein n=1 Tax=Zopfia rhizophila CBS 207.26 TaxID=1314779 RepID=A0A6A6ERH5_9PEZI|nr:hypothetical protein K469DRAFT_694740 [Zopfia rhizophila CBS 207.26]
MRFSILSSAIMAFLLSNYALSVAIPTEASPGVSAPIVQSANPRIKNSREEQAGAGVYMSTEPDWGYRETQGLWQWLRIVPNLCHDLTVYDKNISSFGPDKGLKCIVYDEHTCKGNKLEIWHPGYARMEWNGWDNRVSSFNCAPDTRPSGF